MTDWRYQWAFLLLSSRFFLQNALAQNFFLSYPAAPLNGSPISGQAVVHNALLTPVLVPKALNPNIFE